LFGSVAQGKNLFLPARSRQQRRDQWIAASVVAAVDRRFHTDRARAKKTAQIVRLARRDRKAEQTRAALDEGSFVIVLCVDPLASIAQFAILGEGIDGAEGALAGEHPLHAGGILRGENQLAFDIEALEIGGPLQLDDLRGHTIRW